MKKYNLTQEESDEYRLYHDPMYFENYCGSCDFFGTDECPHNGNVADITRWKIDIQCDKFND